MRLPYLVSMLGHLLVFSFAFLLSTFVVHRPPVPSIISVFEAPPLGGGTQAMAADEPDRELPAQPLEDAGLPEEADTPPRQPDPAPPKPVKTSSEPPSPEGRLDPADAIESIDGELEPRTAPVQPVAEPVRPSQPDDEVSADDAVPGDANANEAVGESVGIEAGRLGAHAPWYLTQMRNKIQGNWSPPARVGQGEIAAQVAFVIHPDGSISGLDLVSSSSIRLFDRQCLSAVSNAAPFGRIPAELGTDPVPILLNFKRTY